MGIYRHFPYSNFHEMNMDELIKIFLDMQEEWNETKEEWATYKDYIDNYFNTLDLSEETYNVIMRMIDTGMFNKVVDPTIINATSEWLTEHITQPVGVVIDNSLTVSGACADAKATGDRINNLTTHKVNQPLNEYAQPTNGENGQVLRTKGDGSTEWVFVGLPSDEQATQAINNWLNEHPEATTTVTDGSITENKLSDILKTKTIKEYVTPEMFGAKGDGITDDTAAIQSALNSNYNCVLLVNNYLTTDSLVFTGAYRSLIGNGTINYSGEDTALIINGHDLFISINIEALTGNGVSIDATIDEWCQYIKFYNMEINAYDKCVKCVRNSENWVNEIIFNFVRFNGKYGFYFDGDYSNGGYRFINCGNEICTEAFIYAYNMLDFSITDCRMAEVPWSTDIIRIINNAQAFIINMPIVNVEAIKIPRNKNSLGSINGALYNGGGARIGAIATCSSGMIIIPNYSFPVSLTGVNDTYNFTDATSNILPTTFVLSYVEGGHAYTINLPTFYNTFPELYIYTQSGLNTVNMKINNVSVANLTFTGSGYYKILKINDTIMLDKVTA